MAKIYYFTPNCSDFITARIYQLTQEECAFKSRNNSEIYEYDEKEFELAFNDEMISDLGYIRIF